MAKQRINVVIDNDVYLKLKIKEGINISSTINELLKTFLEYDNIEYPEEIEIERRICEAKDTIKDLQEEMNNLTIMLTKVREDNKAKKDDEMAKQKAMITGIIDSGLLRDVA